MQFQRDKNKYKNQFSNTFKLVFCSSMISVATIFSIIGSFVAIPFFAQMSLAIDISIVFLIPIIFVCSLSFALLSSCLNALLHFIWDAANWIGILILLFSNVITILLFYLFSILMNKKENIKNRKIKWFYVWIFVIFFNVIILTVLNGILFTPLYWWWLSPSIFKTINFIEVSQIYNNDPNLHIYLLGIPNYWGGIFGLYSFFNLCKFILVAIFSIPVLFFFQKYSLTSKLF